MGGDTWEEDRGKEGRDLVLGSSRGVFWFSGGPKKNCLRTVPERIAPAPVPERIAPAPAPERIIPAPVSGNLSSALGLLWGSGFQPQRVAHGLGDSAHKGGGFRTKGAGLPPSLCCPRGPQSWPNPPPTPPSAASLSTSGPAHAGLPGPTTGSLHM